MDQTRFELQGYNRHLPCQLDRQLLIAHQLGIVSGYRKVDHDGSNYLLVKVNFRFAFDLNAHVKTSIRSMKLSSHFLYIHTYQLHSWVIKSLVFLLQY